MGTYARNKRARGRWEGDINKLINLQSPSLLFLPFSHIFKVKLKLKFKDLINYQNVFHKSKTFFPGHEVLVSVNSCIFNV
jgi:hypothetical protein